MRSHCVVYTANAGYLFPALASAIQARDQVDRSATDIIIVCVGDRGAEYPIIQDICEELGIRLIAFPESVIGGLHPMYARLFLSDLIEPSYQRALYLDSDTQVVGDLRPLFAAPLAPGRFMAARDPMCMVEDDFPFPDGILDNFERAGFSADERANYFNSGMLMIHMDGWAETSAQCRAWMARLDKPFRFPDQDILNLVGRDKVDLVSLCWNFPAFLLGTVADRIVKPRVLHFMSRPRPWEGAFYPWGSAGMQPYREMIRRYPALGIFRPRLTTRRYLRYHMQQLYKAVHERPRWNNAAIGARVTAQEQGLVV